MRAVLLAALCATLAAGFELYPAGGTRVWTGALITSYYEVDGTEGCYSPMVFMATLTVNNATLKWNVPGFDNGTVSHPMIKQLDTVKSHNASAEKLLFSRSGLDIYTSYKIISLPAPFPGVPGNHQLVLTYCMGPGADDYPSDTAGPMTCSEQVKCYEANLYDAEYGNYYQGAPPEQDAYCHTYCNRMLTSCTGNHTVFANGSDCMAACTNYPNTGMEPDLVRASPTVTVGYNSKQCRTYQAGLAFDMPAVACPLAAPNSVLCAMPSTPCDRVCDITKSPAYSETCTGATDAPVKPFENKEECMTQCAQWEFPLEPVSAASLGKNTFQCRAAVAGAMSMPPDPQLEPIKKLVNTAYCNAFLPSGGALCAGVDYTANFTGVYQPVTGLCKPGAGLGGCCCPAGPTNITRSPVPFPNFVRMVVPTSGGASCLGMAEMDLPTFMIMSPNKAVTSFVAPGVGIEVGMELLLSNGANEISLVNKLTADCPAHACKNKNGVCTKDKIVFSAAPSVGSGSLAAVVLASVVVALANLLA